MSFAHPSWLFLLILVPLLGIAAVLVARVRRRRWSDFVAPRLREALLLRSSSISHWASLILLLFGTALLILAIAGPQGDAGTSSEKVKGRNVLFALDLSRSMRTADVKPDRLSQAKVLMYELMDAMPNDRVGLIGFAGVPYLFEPLTIDHAAIRETVEQIDEEWLPTGGSDIVAALKLSIETLKKTGIRNNALVLISDGEKHSGKLDDVLAEAERAGVYVFTVGVGTEAGDFIPYANSSDGHFHDIQDRPVISKMQPEVLREIAEKTKGRFAIAGSGVDIPALARSAMSDLDEFELKGREKKVVIEFYQWFLAPGILCLLCSILAATRWRPIAARAGLAALVASAPAANALTPEDAAKSLASGQAKEAQEQFESLAKDAKKAESGARYRLGAATAADQLKDFKKSSNSYSGALLSKDPEVVRNAHLGMGQALFQLGWQSLSNGESYPTPAPKDFEAFDKLFDEALVQWAKEKLPDSGETDGYLKFERLITNWTDAIHHYDSALRLRPDAADAKQNRTVVVDYLKHLKERLKQESDMRQMMMQQMGGGMPQQGQPQPGEGEGEEGGEGEPKEGGNDGNEQNGNKGDQPQDGKDGGEDENKDGKGNGDEKQKDQDGDNGKDQKEQKAKAGESPRERALRILGENQDIQKGPLNPGRREFSRPSKDW